MPALIGYKLGMSIFFALCIMFLIITACIEHNHKILSKITMVLMIVCLIAGVSAVGSTLYLVKPIHLQKINSVENIVSLNDNKVTNGRVYYRSMYINESQYYQYMVDLGNGQYIQNQVPSNETYVSYISKNDTTSKPRVEWLTKRRQFFIFYENETYWHLYVPEGTIAEGFNIDLK